MPRPERFTPYTARAPLGVLVATGHDGIDAAVTAAMLAQEAHAEGSRVLLISSPARAERITALFGVMQPVIEHPVLVSPGISVAASMPAILDADVVISVPAAKVRDLLDAIDLLAARTAPTNAVILADHGGAAMAAAFAVLKLVHNHRPQLPATVTGLGDADLAPLHDAAERWLGCAVRTTPSLPIDPTLPVALGAGIPLAEAVADTALTTAAGALWSALASSATTGAIV